MRHRIKKIPNLISNHLLHSNKSTYFYNSKLRYYMAPICVSNALLLVLGLMIFPSFNDNIAMAVGEEPQNDDGMTLSLSVSSETIGTNSDGSAPAEVGKPSYGGVILTTTAQGINKTTGYSIYVQAANGSSRNLVNNIDASNMIEPISDANGIVGTEIPQNQWGYAIQKGTAPSYSAMTYKPIAATGQTSPAAIDGKEELNNDTFTLAFGANIGEGKLAGHYTTNVLVSLVAEAKALVTYQLIYNGNGNTSGVVPETQAATNRNDSQTFTVAGNTGNLEKTNYEFLGWADTANETTAKYVAGDEITINRVEGLSTAPKTIYAVWKDAITPTTPITNWTNVEYMQQMTPQACADAKVGDSKTLTDNSAGDNSKKTYTVQKMQINDECWMTENMDNETGRMTQYSSNGIDYGGYYDWENAKAICTKMGDEWELPSQTQYQSIVSSHNTGAKLITSPYKFSYGGFSSGSSPINAGRDGYCWSSTPNGSKAYYLGFYSSSAHVNGSDTYYGYPVRCVVKK